VFFDVLGCEGVLVLEGGEFLGVFLVSSIEFIGYGGEFVG